MRQPIITHRPRPFRASALARGFGAFLITIAGIAGTASASESLIRRYLSHGNDAYQAGDLHSAVREWTTAVDICRLKNDASGEAEALARRGEALGNLGYLHDALRDLRLALDAARAAGEPGRIAAVEGALGNALFLARDLSQARVLLHSSRASAKRLGEYATLAASANNLGNLHVATGSRGDAVAAFAEAETAAMTAGDQALVATAMLNRARAVTLDEPSTASRLARSASARAASLPSPRDRLATYLGAGKVLAGIPADHGAAYDAFRAAAILASQSNNRRATSVAWGELGALYETARRWREAEDLTRRALFAAQEIDAKDLLFRWEWQAGRLQKALGRPDEALDSFRRAVADLQAIRQDIPIEYRDGRSSFRENIGALFFGLADLLLRTADGAAGPHVQRAGLLEEARDTVETLKVAELRDYFRDQCTIAIKSKAAVVEKIADRTATVYPIPLDDRLEILVSYADGMKRVAVPVGRDRLTSEVRQLRSFLEKRTTREYLTPARQVYDWLIRPLERDLADRGVDTIIFVPDGALRTIPLAALHNGHDFLIRRYAVATAPGLTLVDPKPLAVEARARTSNSRILLAGLSEAVQGYPPLPSVDREIAALQEIEGGGGAVLRNAGFRVRDVDERLRAVPYSIVHIASHGEFGSDPENSFILAHDGRITLDLLERTIKFGELRAAPLELLSLSACRTAAGDDRAALGLAGVAVKAGARSALASLWFISDEASSEIVIDFYGRLRDPSGSKAKALQQAQLAMLQDRRFQHPGYWSPFLIIGNWL